MSWEENCASSCSSVTEEEIRDAVSPEEQTVMQLIDNSSECGQKSLSKSSSNTSQSQSIDEVDDYIMEQSAKHTLPDAQWEMMENDVDKSNKLNGSNKVPFLEESDDALATGMRNISQVVEVGGEGGMVGKNCVGVSERLAQSRRGNFKKTISFDDKVLTSCGEEKKKSGINKQVINKLF
jgi:hypothetical protein